MRCSMQGGISAAIFLCAISVASAREEAELCASSSCADDDSIGEISLLQTQLKMGEVQHDSFLTVTGQPPDTTTVTTVTTTTTSTSAMEGGINVSWGRTMVDKGLSGCVEGQECDECEGHCQTDADCKAGLKCYHRHHHEDVPGCSRLGSGNVLQNDYCAQASYFQYDFGLGCTEDQQCEECEGGCDSDNECLGDLRCFQRGDGMRTHVPGCFPAYNAPRFDVAGGAYCYRKTMTLAFGDHSSYCVQTLGSAEQQNVTTLAENASSLQACHDMAQEGGYKVFQFWPNAEETGDRYGHCHGLRSCPFEHDCRTKVCAANMAGVVTYPAQLYYTLTFGDHSSYCVDTEGNTTMSELTYHHSSGHMLKCAEKVEENGGTYFTYFPDGRCYSIEECPYEHRCTADSCNMTTNGVRVFTIEYT